MPYARQQENQEEVAVGFARSEPVSAKRNIAVIAEPCGERQMPAPPELGDALGDIREVEVARKLETKDQAKPDRHG